MCRQCAGRGQGALPAGHAESRPVAALKGATRSIGLRLPQSAEATVPRGGSPGPARRRESMTADSGHEQEADTSARRGGTSRHHDLFSMSSGFGSAGGATVTTCSITDRPGKDRAMSHYHDSDDLKALGEFKKLAPAEFK